MPHQFLNRLDRCVAFIHARCLLQDVGAAPVLAAFHGQAGVIVETFVTGAALVPAQGSQGTIVIVPAGFFEAEGTAADRALGAFLTAVAGEDFTETPITQITGRAFRVQQTLARYATEIPAIIAAQAVQGVIALRPIAAAVQADQFLAAIRIDGAFAFHAALAPAPFGVQGFTDFGLAAVVVLVALRRPGKAAPALANAVHGAFAVRGAIGVLAAALDADPVRQARGVLKAFDGHALAFPAEGADTPRGAIRIAGAFDARQNVPGLTAGQQKQKDRQQAAAHAILLQKKQ